MIFARIAIGVLPVFAFLGLLVILDSFKLVPLRAVLRSLLIGGGVAMVAFLLNTGILDGTRIDPVLYRRYVAPVLEEILKAIYVVNLIRRRRVGFMVDAAIHGFAIGAGFAAAENVYYARMMASGSIFLWIARGFGTAIVHGSTMAIFATLSKDLADRRRTNSWHILLPGLAIAIGVHSLFNHFLLHPLLMAALLFVVLPLFFIAIFERSERATRLWLGSGFDRDLELIDVIQGVDLHESRVGAYLQSLHEHFPPAVVGDMLCYLQIYSELSMRAKAQLLAREAGITLAIEPSVRANLDELRFLENSIGATGKLALQPFLQTSSRDLWQLGMLQK